MSLKRLSLDELFKLYNNIYDRLENKAIRKLKPWYRETVEDYRLQLLNLLALLPEVEEENFEIIQQSIFNLLDREETTELFVTESMPVWTEADKTIIVFGANNALRDEALREDQIDKDGKPIIAAIAGTAAIGLRRKVEDIAKLTTKTIASNMTTDVLKNKVEGISDDEAVEKTVKKFSSKKQEDWRLRRNVRSNLTTFLGDRSYNMILQNDMYTKKGWRDRDDNRVRDSHTANTRQGSIPKDQAFQNGQMYAGDRSVAIKEWINCRCYTFGVR